MPKMIFVNLPVTDLKRSIAFYEAVGATQDHRFSDDTAAGMTFSDAIHVMIMTHEKFAGFVERPIGDPRVAAHALVCISAEDRAEVDRVAEAAGAHGGQTDLNAPDEYGFMYGRSFADPDGHIWQVMWMDAAAVEAGPDAFAASQLEPA